MAKEIKRLALFLISIFPTQVYLRVGYEFDSPENNYQPLQYVTAYRRIVNDLRMLGVVNVAYVWHSYSQTPQSGWEQSNWYPGDYLMPHTMLHMHACILTYIHKYIHPYIHVILLQFLAVSYLFHFTSIRYGLLHILFFPASRITLFICITSHWILLLWTNWCFQAMIMWIGAVWVYSSSRTHAK